MSIARGRYVSDHQSPAKAQSPGEGRVADRRLDRQLTDDLDGWNSRDHARVSAMQAASRPHLEVPDLYAKAPGRRRGRALAVTDFLGAVLAVPLALLLLSAISNVPRNSLSQFWSNLAVDWLFPVGVLIALAISGFYRSARRLVHPSTFVELKDLAFGIGMGCVLGLALGLLGHRVLGTSEPVATQMVLATVVAVPVIAAGRASFRSLRQAVYGSRIVLVGCGHLSRQIETYLSLQKGNEVIGHVVDPESVDLEALTEPGCLGTIADLPTICTQHGVERVIVGFPTATSPSILAVLRSLQHQVKMAVVPRYFDLVSWRSTLTDLYGLPLIELAAPHISKWDRFIKRTFDVAVSGFALVLLLPVLALESALIRLTSGGPALFHQTRIGHRRKPFTIHKFRTMSIQRDLRTTDPGAALSFDGSAPNRAADNASTGRFLYESRNKLEEQPRVTAIGRFLRKAGLDEIPQFWNVLVGDMSLVGPRPFIPTESKELEGWATIRFEVRPGITGLWQVSGRNDVSIDQLERLDYLYVASWSMWWDIKILWDTPRAVWRGIGAY
jgi:exopolysaccharide biosynthesis polyprenyl glycosylphosphotransferase